MAKLCIDLCCGLGGFSQAFKEDPNWKVVTVDINPRFKPSIVADVRYLPFRESLKPDVLLMSPPCERFSLMANSWPKMGIRQALEIVGACLEAVAWLKPKQWLMENPKARLRWFIGIPRTTIRYSDYEMTYQVQKPTDFWGNVNLPLAAFQRQVKTKRRGKRCINFEAFYCNNGRAKRAFIPLSVSRAIKQGVEGLA